MKAIYLSQISVHPSSDGSLLDGSKSKSDAVTEIMKAAEVEPNESLPMKPDCAVFDAMRLLNEMNTKNFKTGKDLLEEFLCRIDTISPNTQIRVVAFDTYSVSLPERQHPHLTKKALNSPTSFQYIFESKH